MKRIFYALLTLCLLIITPLDATATHLAGAEISYSHEPTSTQPHRYRIVLILYRDINAPAGFFPTVNVNISKNCTNNVPTSVTLNRSIPPGATIAGDGGYFVPGYDDCSDASNPGYVPLSQHYYDGFVELPYCSEYRISYSTCCRSGCIDNLASCAALACTQNCTDGTYVEAILRNPTNLGHNTSPQFLTSAAKAFCVNSTFVWSHPTQEPNGDSIFYTLAEPLDNGPNNPVAFAPGYSYLSPITTAPGSGGIQINSAIGTFLFTTSSQQEVCVAAVRVQEYRYDSTAQSYFLVGTSLRDMQLTITGSCLSSVLDGPEVDISQAGFGQDTVLGDVKGVLAGVRIYNDSIADPSSITGWSHILPTVPYNCGDSVIQIVFDNDVLCSSYSSDGTEFRLIGPDSVARPVVGVEPYCRVDGYSNYVDLKLYKPLTVNGEYYLYFKDGNDGNTILDECGFAIPEYYTILLKVQNCFTPVFDMKNVTVDTNWTIRVQYDFDTNSFPTHLFTGVEIYRSDDNGGTYNKLTTFTGPNAFNNKEWTDFSVGPGEVENFRYRYRIKGVVNQEVYQETRNITSINLDTISGPDPSVLQLAWNRYNGWLNVNYQVMFSDNPDDPASWAPVTGQGINPTIDTNFTFTIPEDSGCYALRIDGINFSNSTYISQSNWEQFCVTPEDSVIPPPPPPVMPDTVVVPNVFTPNGDNQNDLFVIQNVQTWSNGSLQVFNRWGALVYETNDVVNTIWDGTDMNSGTVLADGVYFYMLTVGDADTGWKDTKQGTVTIFSGGL